jgi:hypothetical protein
MHVIDSSNSNSSSIGGVVIIVVVVGGGVGGGSRGAGSVLVVQIRCELRKKTCESFVVVHWDTVHRRCVASCRSTAKCVVTQRVVVVVAVVMRVVVVVMTVGGTRRSNGERCPAVGWQPQAEAPWEAACTDLLTCQAVVTCCLGGGGGGSGVCVCVCVCARARACVRARVCVCGACGGG